ncbi:MAG TPA: phosphatase PAP2 family protein [Ktedonobacteraceae bacterium]|jgi:membrane-associated phospholipid phosphatase|nr:phosphatase PAP2 family protein [Ktedonobacteraceae bacterium]
MQEQLTDGADEQTIIEAPGTNTRRMRIARYVSYILAPATISLPFILLVAFYQTQDQLSALIYACITLFFLSVGPLLYIIIGVRLGKLSDIDVSRRTQRAGPFIFGIVSVMIGWLVLTLTNGPRNLQTVMIITVFSGIIMMVITFWWKISMHASSLGGVATMLTVLYGAVMLPLFVLLILVSWSRVVLRRHTVSQVIAGSLAGILLSLVILKIRGVN